MSEGKNTELAVGVGVDLIKALIDIFQQNKDKSSPTGEILADVSSLLPIIQKRLIDKVPYTEAEAHELLAYIGVVDDETGIGPHT